MDKTNINCSAPLTRQDDPLLISLIPATDVTNNKRRSSVFSKDITVSNKTPELKRSIRLSRKCTYQDKSAIKGVCKSKYMSKNFPYKKTNRRISALLKDRNSILANNGYNNASIVQSSVNTNNVEKNEEISIKKTLKHKKLEENDNFVFNRKRGRPLLKQIQLKKSNVINACKDEFNQPKPNSLSLIVEKLHNVNESKLSKNLDKNMMVVSNKKLQQFTKNFNSDNLSIENETNSSCSIVSTNLSEAITVPTVSSETSIISELSDKNHQSSYFGMSERETILLAKRFNIPSKIIRKNVLKKSLSVFRENYLESVTSSMVTLSPIVVKGIDDYYQHNTNGDLIKYKIEPNRGCVAYEKSNLKELMNELSKKMPSWSLSIVPNPPRYVISHILIDTYGTPIVSKSIVLDRYFRASVYINQCLEYKYCKRYTTSSDIVNLIKKLNDL